MTIAQQIKWDFETNGCLNIQDKNDNLIYFEDSNRFWEKYERDSQGNQIYLEDSNGYWSKREWDSQGNVIYFENSVGQIRDDRPKPCAKWNFKASVKWNFKANGNLKEIKDKNGNVIYYENSYGEIIDYRPKPCENKEILIGGEKFKLVKV
jgi:hypothetical protein